MIFDANGGIGERIMTGAGPDSVYLMPECTFTAPEGMRFAGWAVGSADGKRMQPGEGNIFDVETTVYAVWENGSTAVKDSVPKTGEMPVAVGLFVLAGISGAGMLSFRKRKMNSNVR